MIDVIQNSTLVLTLFHFLTGLPSKSKGTHRGVSTASDDTYSITSSVVNDDDNPSKASFSSILDPSLGKNFDNFALASGNSGHTDSITRHDEDGSIVNSEMMLRGGIKDGGQFGGRVIGKDGSIDNYNNNNGGGLLSHFNMRLKKINLENKNKQTRFAIGGVPRSVKQSMTSSVTSSVACARYEDKLHDQKCDQLIGLIDSVLRRNKEGESSGDEDDVLFGEDKNEKNSG